MRLSLCLQSHYSLSKGAGVLGIGINNMIKVKVDSRGRMDPEDLERCILESRDEVCTRHDYHESQPSLHGNNDEQ